MPVKSAFSRELTAVGWTLLLLILGLAAVWTAKNGLGLDTEKDAVFVSLLLVPLLAYMLFSGRIQEIRAPGGIEAKFREAATQSAETSVETIQPTEMEVVVKGGPSELVQALQSVDETKPVILKLSLGHSYYVGMLEQYLDRLTQKFRNFKFVVFLDADENFVGYMAAWRFKQTLSVPALGQQLLDSISAASAAQLRQFPGLQTETISTTTTNVQALKAMHEQNLDAMVVVDARGKLAGAVERDRVLGNLMLAMAGESVAKR